MPLSEEELRMLEQMERALVEEDPKLASTMRGATLRQTTRRRAVLGGLGFAAGIAVLMTGAIMNLIPVGIVGFVVMLASATLVVTALRGRSPSSETPPQGRTKGGFTVVDGGRSARRKPSGSSGDSFISRMEERWRRRRDENGRF